MAMRAVLAAVLSFTLLMGAGPAFAGFEFKGAATSPPPREKKAEISWDKNIPPMPSQKVPEVEAAAVPQAAGKKIVPAPAVSELVSGFGNDLPLSVALEQVVPPSYMVSLDPAVDAGTSVSWQGERPWKQVLADMLSARGLGFSLEGNTLVVRKSDAKAEMSVKAEPVPPKAPAPAVPAAPSKVDMIPGDMILDRALLKKEEAGLPPPVKKDVIMEELAVVTAKEVPPPVPASEPVTIRRERAAATAPSGKVMGSLAQSAAWQGEKGQTLREVLSSWAGAAGVEFFWTIDYDYRLNGPVSLGGSFDEAVGTLLERFARVKPQPYGQLYKKTDGRRVLMVGSYDVRS